MGLISILGKAVTGVSRFLGFAAPAATGIVAGGARIGGRILRSPVAQGLAGAAAFELGARAFGGQGGGAVPMGPPIPAGATPLVGGFAMLTAQDGSRFLVNNRGVPVRAKFIIPSTAKLPGGARIVFISADGSQIGVSITRRRRQFGAEIRRVRRTIKAAEAVVKACKPRRRSS